MDILDKLFSRELNRRTGERAIEIERNIKIRSRNLGKNALSAAGKKKQKLVEVSRGKESRSNLFQRLNIRFPWLKVVFVVAIGAIVVLDLLDVTVPRTGEPLNKIRVAPMSKHVKATDRVLVGKKLVALTFDDGPSSVTTPRLLDILLEKDVPATFFMLGSQARNNPDIVKRADREWHEVASHTMYHQNLPRISAAAAASDINEAKDTLNSILGHSVRYTRPPYGNISDSVRAAAGTPLILWSVDTLDWQNRNVEIIMANVKRQVSDGGIILMHDIYDTSVDAVGMIIDELRNDGYEFATIPEIARERGLTLENGAAYRSL